MIVHGGGKAEVSRTSSSGRIGRCTPVLSLLGLLLLLELSLCKEFNLILLSLKAEDFHLHHLHLEALSLLNVYARGEWQSCGVYLRGSALLVGEPGTIDSGGKGGLVESALNVDVLGFRVVPRFLIVGGKTREIESCTGGGSVGNVGRSGANTAGTKASEEGGTVVLVGNSHRKWIGRESDGLLNKLHEAKGIAQELESNWEGRVE